MQIILILTFQLILNGCVSFEKRNIFDETKVPIFETRQCVNLKLYTLPNGFFDNNKVPKEVDEVTKNEILASLEKFNIYTSCEKPIGNYGIIIDSDMTAGRTALVSVWSIFTVLSLGIIPLVVDQNTKFILSKEEKKVVTSELKHTKVIWAGFVFKQISDDAKSVRMYSVHSTKAARSLQIGEMLSEQIKLDFKGPTQ